jgi:catechol 2,3-dioxygenase-like lactoylglutathione lyase family enzyme
MSRVQLSLNVADLDEAVEHYSRYFGVSPAKEKPGYANFAIADPPLKLILVESGAQPGTINHMGVEVADSEAVAGETARMAGAGIDMTVDPTHTCCYATQDKAWTTSPDGLAWEVYAVLADSDEAGAAASDDCSCEVDGQSTGDVEEAAAACCAPTG